MSANGPFNFEMNIHGAHVTARGQQITEGCLSEGSVDEVIRFLEKDLGEVAKLMKAAIRQHLANPLPPEFDVAE